MFLLNLSLAEFLVIFGALSGLVITLYLLSRARRKQVVSTLRFWDVSAKSTAARSRKRIQQPLSLILQLIGLLLLVLAVAQLRTGGRGRPPADHVLLLDTSSWMAAQNGNRTLLDQAKEQARLYVEATPPSDRVMIVHADGLSTPATGLESKREALIAAIDRARPSASALNLDQALVFANEVRSLHARRPGEIVYIGAGRSSAELKSLPAAGLRVISIPSKADNVGLRSVSLRRSAAEHGLWQIFIAARNYGSDPRSVPLIVQFGGAPVGTTRLLLRPGRTEEANFQFRTRAAGWLEARLLVQDVLKEDDRVILEIPQQKQVRIAAYSAEPELLRPILAAHTNIDASYFPPAQYRPDPPADVLIVDRFRPSKPPAVGSIWIEPVAGSGFTTRTTLEKVTLERWGTEQELTTGLKSRQLKLESASVFAPSKGDIPVADSQAGPVILARPKPHPAVAFGYHPGRQSIRYDLTTPLVFANVLRWMAPDVFRLPEMHAGSAGSVVVPLEPKLQDGELRVIGDDQQEIPFTVSGSSLRFFSGHPGTVRVMTGSTEQVYSLTLPEVAEMDWEIPASASKGIPAAGFFPAPEDWWPLLAAAGGLVLLVEYLLYGRSKPKLTPAARGPWRHLLRKAS